MTSSIFFPRRSRACPEPRTHLMESTMLVLPEPFGPTIAVTPPSNRISVWRANVLKPSRLSERRNKLGHAAGGPAERFGGPGGPSRRQGWTDKERTVGARRRPDGPLNDRIGPHGLPRSGWHLWLHVLLQRSRCGAHLTPRHNMCPEALFDRLSELAAATRLVRRLPLCCRHPLPLAHG